MKPLTAPLLVAMMLSACGAPLAQDNDTPIPSGDIREQVVAALQQPGRITEVRLIIREPAGPEGQDYCDEGLDGPHQ